MKQSPAIKPLLKVLGGDSLSPPPLWLMRQAGRYLPEYRDLRAKAGSFLGLCFNPELAAEVTLQPVRRFGFDGAILFADILLIPYGLGVGLEFKEGEGPALEPVVDSAGLRRLRPGQVMERVAPVFETVRRVKAALPDGATLIGFAGAPWTVATYMIAGRGTPDQAPAKLLAHRDPEFVRALLDALIEPTVDYLSAQVEAGCEVVQLFDTWAGGLSAALFETAVLEPTAKIVRALKAHHPTVPIIGFPRAAGLRAGRYAEATGVDALGLATSDDIALARQLVPKVVLQGNLDPLTLLAGGEALRTGVEDILRAIKGRPHIFNLGHGIVPATPPEHVQALVSLVRGTG